MDALDLLDYDCWAEVFKKLEKDDFSSVSNTCKIFRKLMDDYRYGFCEGKWKFDLILPQLMPYLGNRDEAGVAIKSRQICRFWMSPIDKILEEREICPKLSFGSLERIYEFLERFGRSNPSPIFLRRLSLFGDRDEEDDLFFPRLLEVTQRFGINVWELEVRQQPPDFLPILQHLLNLKDLRFHLPRLVNETLELLILWLRYALPDLPQLRRLEMYGGVDIGGACCMRKYAPQIEHLVLWRLDGFFTANLAIHRMFIQRFRAIKTLVLMTPIDSAENVLAILEFLDCPLESFEFTMASETEEEPWQIDTFLKSISHLHLLRNLDIRLRTVYFSKSERQIDYSNPNITHLKLTIDGYTDQNKMSLYFLPSLTQLQHLTLQFDSNKEIQLGLQTSEELRDGIFVQDFIDNHQIRHYHLYDASHSNNIWDTTTLTRITLARGYAMGEGSLHISREECDAYRNLRAQIN